MIDKLDAQLAPIDKELRGYARRQSGCKALMGLYGIGDLTAVTILAELGDATRFSSSRDAVRYSGLDTRSNSPTGDVRPAISLAKDRPRYAGRCSRLPSQRTARPAPTAPTTYRRPTGSAVTARVWRSRASF
jgi:Transposase IS116/IS110/IS902 family